jgi:hypothetical protein
VLGDEGAAGERVRAARPAHLVGTGRAAPQPPRSRAGTAGPAGTVERRSVGRGTPGRVRAAMSPRSDRRAPRLHRPPRAVAAQPPAEQHTPGFAVVDAGLDQLPGTELPQPLKRGDRDGQPVPAQLPRGGRDDEGAWRRGLLRDHPAVIPEARALPVPRSLLCCPEVVDQDSIVLDILVQSRSSAKSAKKFFRLLLRDCGTCRA